MSRRVKRPLAKRPTGDRPKGARPYRGSPAERAQPHRPDGKPAARFSPPRTAKPAPFVGETAKAVVEPPPLPAKVQTVVVSADENNMRVDRFLEFAIEAPQHDLRVVNGAQGVPGHGHLSRSVRSNCK